jgi:hypothetical protein
MTAGDRARLTGGTATGTVITLRGEVAEVRWDTGARCAVPIGWLKPGGTSARQHRSARASELVPKRQSRRNGSRRPLVQNTSQAALAVTAGRSCARCGADLVPARSDARYCGDACRQAAHRERKQDGR